MVIYTEGSTAATKEELRAEMESESKAEQEKHGDSPPAPFVEPFTPEQTSINGINKKHLNDLRASGLSDETIKLSGCYSADAKETRAILGFNAGPGLVFPYSCGVDGNKKFARVKPDKPFKSKEGREAKYLTARGGSNHFYIHPAVKNMAQDTTKPLAITEGEKKTLKANQEGIPTIGLAGVWSWRKKDKEGNSEPIPDFDLFSWKGRKVCIVFDSDISEKEGIQWAEYKLAEELRKRYAIVECIRISHGGAGKKQGLDDYLLHHSKDDFWKLPRLKPQVPVPLSIEEILEAFKQKWEEGNEDERDKSLTKIVHRLGECTVLQRSRAFNSLKSITGHTKKVLEDVYRGGERRKKEKAKENVKFEPGHSSSDLKILTYVVNQDKQNKLFKDIVDTVSPTNKFFNYNGELVFIRKDSGPVLLVERNITGYLSPFLEIAYYVDEGKGINLKRYAQLSSEFAKTFVHSPKIISQFSRIKQYTRSPVFDEDWNFIATPGFHHASGIYYDGPEIQPTEDTKTLDYILDDFCWKSGGDRVNFIGMLITAITMPNWIDGHPFIAFNGNKPGVGKSLLAKILSVVVDGKRPGTVSFNPNDEEFEKQLATRVNAGDRVIIIDNAKKNTFSKQIESPILERSVTDSTLNFRRLGSNTAISRPNDVIFCLTMNFTQMSRDLQRRNIPVNLEQSANVRDVKFKIKEMEKYVLEHRLELIAELAGMVIKRLSLGKLEIENPAKHSVGQEWAEVIDSILRANGNYGFLKNFDESEHAFDPNYSDMVNICRLYKDNASMPASGWAEILVDDILEHRLTNKGGTAKPKRSQATIVGNLFSQYLDKAIEVEDEKFSVLCEDFGKGHPKKYSFGRISGENG